MRAGRLKTGFDSTLISQEELHQLPKDPLIDIIFALAAQNTRLDQRIVKLEATVNQPRKATRGSSLPPSPDEKPTKVTGFALNGGHHERDGRR